MTVIAFCPLKTGYLTLDLTPNEYAEFGPDNDGVPFFPLGQLDLTDFRSGENKDLVQGKMPNGNYVQLEPTDLVCVVTEEIAIQNGWKKN